MKRLLAAAAALLLCLNILPTAHGMGTSAGSAILMEAESGRVLYEQDADRPRLIASVTKLMTALVALESGHPLEEKVVIREEDTRTEGSSLYLRPGEELRLETLLYGLLLQSGNDAALAVARHCGGTVENFVAQMNLRAARLGMEHSRFANPSGLNAEGHCSTARDLALLARACLKNETLAAIAATRSVTLEGRSFVNHNKLLWRYEGCVGLKTGYTEKAGRTLVSAAEREGMTLIAGRPGRLAGPCRPVRLGLLQLEDGDGSPGGGGGLLPAGGGQPGPLLSGPGGSRSALAPAGGGAAGASAGSAPGAAHRSGAGGSADRHPPRSGGGRGSRGGPAGVWSVSPQGSGGAPKGTAPAAAKLAGRALNEKEAA